MIVFRASLLLKDIPVIKIFGGVQWYEKIDGQEVIFEDDNAQIGTCGMFGINREWTEEVTE